MERHGATGDPQLRSAPVFTPAGALAAVAIGCEGGYVRVDGANLWSNGIAGATIVPAPHRTPPYNGRVPNGSRDRLETITRPELSPQIVRQPVPVLTTWMPAVARAG